MKILTLLVFLALAPALTSAHVPVFSNEQTGIQDAYVVEDPLKSWAIYQELDPDVPRYFKLSLVQGERLFVSVSLVNPEDEVELLIIAPEIEGEHHDIEAPEGYGVLEVEGEVSQASYEPFAPSYSYRVASYDQRVDLSGDYYVAILSHTGGSATLAIGYLEQFTLEEWILVPLNVINSKIIEGQNPLPILSPLIATLVIGWWLIRRRLTRPHHWLVGAGGLLLIGGSFVVLLQMVIALAITGIAGGAIVTLFFIIAPLALGWASFKKIQKTTWRTRDVLTFGLYGILGLVVWGGFVIGPLLLIVGALLSQRQ